MDRREASRNRHAMPAPLCAGRPKDSESRPAMSGGSGRGVNMATDFDYELLPPKLARQKDLDTCWACCMTGLLAANMSTQQMSESNLVAKYGTTKTGGISIDKLKDIAKDFGYLFNAFQDVAAARSILKDSFVIDRLRGNGMLMAAWRIHDPAQPTEVFFHAQIVWGVTYMSRQDIGTERALLRTMNPFTKAYESYPLFSVYRSDNMPLFTCWPNTRSSS
jgi:hypothetical protein